jgi:hypothetical protein
VSLHGSPVVQIVLTRWYEFKMVKPIPDDSTISYLRQKALRRTKKGAASGSGEREYFTLVSSRR